MPKSDSHQPNTKTKVAASLRIDAPIKPLSRYQVIISAAMMMIVAVLASLAHLTIGQYLALALMGVMTGGLIWLRYKPLIGLTQPELMRPLSAHWHLIIATTRGEALWHAELIQAQDYGLAVVLSFDVVHPTRRSLSCTIFCDQVTGQTWHQLKVLGQVAL